MTWTKFKIPNVGSDKNQTENYENNKNFTGEKSQTKIFDFFSDFTLQNKIIIEKEKIMKKWKNYKPKSGWGSESFYLLHDGLFFKKDQNKKKDPKKCPKLLKKN